MSAFNSPIILWVVIVLSMHGFGKSKDIHWGRQASHHSIRLSLCFVFFSLFYRLSKKPIYIFYMFSFLQIKYYEDWTECRISSSCMLPGSGYQYSMVVWYTAEIRRQYRSFQTNFISKSRNSNTITYWYANLKYINIQSPFKENPVDECLSLLLSKRRLYNV